MTATDKLTPRKLEALASLLVNDRLTMKRDAPRPDGRVTWSYVRNMGGAGRRMRDDLIDAGLLSTTLREVDRNLAARFSEYGGKLTAKGLRVLVDDAERRGDAELADLAVDALEKRRALEADIAAAVAELEAQQAADRDQARRDRRARHLAELQLVLDRHGLGSFAAGKTDDELIAFASDVEGAQYA